jgi:ParB-like chromosome segregation protein Spo0J
MTRQQRDHLRESIRKFGLIDKPICTKDGLLIGGHQRKKILQSLDIKEVDCYIPDRELTEHEIRELNVRLNKAGGSFDFDILGNQFDVIELVNLGFEPSELGLDDEEDQSAGESEPTNCSECGRAIKAKKQRRATPKADRP